MRYNWGNGDGRFLYPPRACFDGGSAPVFAPPNGSMRLEILRDGIEDYEYFAMLSRLDPANPLLEAPPGVTESLTRFTVRPEPVKAHRRDDADRHSDRSEYTRKAEGINDLYNAGIISASERAERLAALR